MKVSEQEVELSGFADADSDEKMRWARVEREAVALCDPLSRMIGRKEYLYHLDVSEGQLSRELSPDYDNRLSLSVGLYTLRRTQHPRLAQLLICDGAGATVPTWQKRNLSPEDELLALRAECRESGAAGQAILEGAARRARRGTP